MAITNASRLADFGSGIGTAGAILQIDNSSKEVGIGTTNPNATLTVGNIGASGTSIYVHGDGRIAGVLTATAFYGDGSSLSGVGVPGVSTTGHSVFNTISVSGIVTAASFSGDGSSLSGVGVPGVSTTGHSVFNTINVSGLSTFTADVSIADKIVHTGDTNTALRFPAADTFTVETAGSERVRVTSAGLVGIGTDNPSSPLTVKEVSNVAIELLKTSNTSILTLGEDGNSGGNINAPSNDLLLSTGGTERLRIDSSSGGVTITDGDLVIGTAGHGIDFSAQTTSSVTGVTPGSEVLDHYEEGTFTPVVDGDATYTRQYGRYVRIGSVVTIVCSIQINAINTSQRIYVGGLPYSASSYGPGAATPSSFSDLNQNVAALLGGVADFGGRCYFNKIVAGGQTSSSNGPDILKDSTRVDFEVTYLPWF